MAEEGEVGESTTLSDNGEVSSSLRRRSDDDLIEARKRPSNFETITDDSGFSLGNSGKLTRFTSLTTSSRSDGSNRIARERAASIESPLPSTPASNKGVDVVVDDESFRNETVGNCGGVGALFMCISPLIMSADPSKSCRGAVFDLDEDEDKFCPPDGSVIKRFVVSNEERKGNKPPFSLRVSAADRRATDSCLACRTASSTESSAIARGNSEDASQSSARDKDPLVRRRKELEEKTSIKLNNGAEIFFIF